MSWFDSLEISASGLTAQRLRLDVISNNLANVNTTRTQNGGPYRRQMVVFAERADELTFAQALQNALGQQKPVPAGKGVRVVQVAEDQSPLPRVYNPQHPDADNQGYVTMPNVNVVTEMVDMISATRAYEANVTALNAAKSMAVKALDIGR
ncbi:MULTISPECIES: flagellar basal body rod protein FlgC [Carboxydocella]|uniref:Flagellar basal-body rod protein FlgC n=2 Tax=Carboxydocella TaxID=178898 RepID=A0A1T4PB39_9FIRM|nr:MULTISPECIES: flagellar basal body rod protein FlgC [Carboxydocella]AVX20777.1 flagellar basal-body rod protein FlgC [Carboxydocella thermautotrophica]AVX31196.1 flagellar basal-body rod protein FlgC [Carboxydocella thermautotrophica]SJZ88734.1 flagellar basal-body rod protein FlgC [Carboxydocella sporoproducens DSM 16521]GAW28306.1 flagellar basal-body rod protein FlgC [Carboxydocella sp. ULO1]GAW32123.1 flagellar basal-body rod protein FlgC [Carboxydocella sp. JDF658]